MQHPRTEAPERAATADRNDNDCSFRRELIGLAIPGSDFSLEWLFDRIEAQDGPNR